MKIAFLDRDGTIVQDYEDKQWSTVNRPAFFPGSISALKILQSLDYQLIIITNQYLINEKFITINQYHSFTSLMLQELIHHDISIKDIFFCPHARWEYCSCKKPNTGMIEAAITKYPNINLEKSILIWDSTVDVDLANRMNITAYKIGAPYGQSINIQTIADLQYVL